MRKTSLIALAVIVVSALLAAVYFLFFTGEGVEVSLGEPSFGTSGDYQGLPQEQLPLGEVDQEAGDEVAPRLIRITEGPVALGAVAFTLPALPAGSTTPAQAADTEIRYLEQASGNAYAFRMQARTLTRISNRTLPGVHDVAWLSDGSMAFARYLMETDRGESIQTYALSFDDTVEGYYLESGLDGVATRGTTTIATLLPSSGGAVATAASPEGENARTVFNTALSNLRIAFSGSSLVAHTKASAELSGYTFLANASGAFDRVVGPQRGLTTLPSPSGKYLFSTYLSGSSLRAELLDLDTRESRPIPLGTLSEKCAWAMDETAIYCAVPRSISGKLPDDWYQGAVSFSDRLWRIDLEGSVAVLLIDPRSVADISVDAVGLTVDPESNILIFTNKSDGSLWAYQL